MQRGQKFSEERLLTRRFSLPFTVRLCTERTFHDLHRETASATVYFYMKSFDRLRAVGTDDIVSLSRGNRLKIKVSCSTVQRALFGEEMRLRILADKNLPRRCSALGGTVCSLTDN